MPAREGDVPGEDSVAGFTVSAVARTLGIPVATLRSWNQRYDLGPSGHNPGRHRYYTSSDVAMLGRMVDLVGAGVSPVNAAKAVRGAAVAASDPVLGDVEPVLAAADLLDAAELLALFTTHFAHFGVVRTWNRLCRPAFADIVDRQAHETELVDVEHVMSWAITAGLHRTAPPLRAAAGLVPILLACTAGEDHVLPLEMLRAALAEAGIPAVLLGAAVPADALAAAIARQPRRPVVVLWSQTRHTASPVPIPAGSRLPAKVLLAGPGWIRPAAEVYPGAQRIDSLEDALGDLVRAAHSL
ncbi:MerR family transcriptional regulator [Nocardia sp. NPDC051750]|uniref:MerR family transcriptional regulator n=1 Tax=Nocardia sp. NPDC051750 TaxID=3364325 RepID=UPI0037A70EAB